MRCLYVFLLLTLLSAVASAEERVYSGAWKTTNRKLDGTMTSAVKELGENKWQGRFYGVWQGVSFDYTVAFTGSPSDLRGTATIDGASYTWTGAIGPSAAADAAPGSVFKGTFGGSRYNGSFELKEKPAQIATRPSATSVKR